MALETVAPFVKRLASDEVGSLLYQLCDTIAESCGELPSNCLVPVLRACALAGIPHVPLFAAAMDGLHGRVNGTQLVGVLEACAAVRLDIPEMREWFEIMITSGVARRLPVAGLTRLTAAAARLRLLDQRHVEMLLDRISNVASHVRPPPPDALKILCHGLFLSGWTPKGPHLWKVASWLAELQVPLQGFSYFGVSLLAHPEGREAISDFQVEIQRAMAAVIASGGVYPFPLSDTSLKFRHEVTEVLRRGNTPYDLDISFGFGVTADVAVKTPGGPLWLLDGPESFHRPFEQGRLQLIPGQRRREEMLASLRSDADIVAKVLERWEGQGETGPAVTAWRTSRCATSQLEGLGPVTRLRWLEWAETSPSDRLSLLKGSSA